MFQSHRPAGRVIQLGFLVAVEVEEWVDPEMVADKLSGSLTWVEGIGKVEIDLMGDISEEAEES